jgi:hypothetical protein
MTMDIGPSGGGKKISDRAFFGVVGVLALVALAVGGYFINRGYENTTVTPVAVAPTNHSQAPGRPTSAGPVAVVRKYFRLASSGKFSASCALESPAYLRWDAQHYAHGSCAAESRADSAKLAAQGISIQLTGTHVVSITGSKATIMATATVGSQVVPQHIYLQKHSGRWLMTGGEDSGGDLGY